MYSLGAYMSPKPEVLDSIGKKDLARKLCYWMFEQIPEHLSPKQLHWLEMAYKDIDNLIAVMGAEELTRGGAEAAREAHNLKVAGSSPAPATKFRSIYEYSK